MALFKNDLILFFVASAIIFIGTFIFLFPKGEKIRTVRSFGLLFFLIGGGLMVRSTIFTVEEGKALVLTMFKKYHRTVSTPGVNFKFPWVETFHFPKRIKSYTEKINARSSDGLQVTLDITTFLKMDIDKLEQVYKEISMSYETMEERIINPTMRRIIRDTVSTFDAQEIYLKRSELSRQLTTDAKKELLKRYVIVDELQLRDIILPSELEQEIKKKLAIQQEAEAMKFQKEKAKIEAEIQEIQARGISNRQEIINSTLTPYLLQMEAIEAYKILAKNSNSTFVIMPTDGQSTGVPLIINKK